MKRLKVIMDTGSRRFIVPGPGGVRVQLSPGSEVYNMEDSHSGHFLLPCSQFGANARNDHSMSHLLANVEAETSPNQSAE